MKDLLYHCWRVNWTCGSKSLPMLPILMWHPISWTVSQIVRFLGIRDQPVIWENELTRSRTPIDMGQCLLIYHQIVNTNKGLVFVTSGVESLVSISNGNADREIFSRATCYFEGWVYGATDYFNVGFQRGHELFLSTHIQGHGSLPVFMLKSHSWHTGPLQISNTGPEVIVDEGFNETAENF